MYLYIYIYFQTFPTVMKRFPNVVRCFKIFPDVSRHFKLVFKCFMHFQMFPTNVALLVLFDLCVCALPFHAMPDSCRRYTLGKPLRMALQSFSDSDTDCG